MADLQDSPHSPKFGKGLFSDGGSLSKWAENPLFLRLTQNKLFKKFPPWVWGAIALGALFAFTWILNNSLNPTMAAPAEPVEKTTTQLAVDILIKLSLVVGLIYGGLWAFRRYRSADIRKGAKKIDVLETIHLSPRRALHLIQAGERLLLIGATDQHVSYLSEIEASAATTVEQVPPAFAELLADKTQPSVVNSNGGALQNNSALYPGEDLDPEHPGFENKLPPIPSAHG